MHINRYVFMYVHELYVYIKISSLKMQHHLKWEILMSQFQILNREQSLVIDRVIPAFEMSNL